jgi:hypothetical protein
MNVHDVDRLLDESRHTPKFAAWQLIDIKAKVT